MIDEDQWSYTENDLKNKEHIILSVQMIEKIKTNLLVWKWLKK